MAGPPPPPPPPPAPTGGSGAPPPPIPPPPPAVPPAGSSGSAAPPPPPPVVPVESAAAPAPPPPPPPAAGPAGGLGAPPPPPPPPAAAPVESSGAPPPPPPAAPVQDSASAPPPPAPLVDEVPDVPLPAAPMPPPPAPVAEPAAVPDSLVPRTVPEMADPPSTAEDMLPPVPSKPKGVEYDESGYKMRTPAELPYDEDLPEVKRVADPSMLRDIAKSSILLIMFMVFFALLLIASLVYLGLIAACDVKGWCDFEDVSARVNSGYLFVTFPFFVPSVYVWASMCAGIFGLLALTYYAYDVIKQDVGTARMVEISVFIREGALTFMAWEIICVLPLCVVLFILLGFGVNWSLAGAYLLGALFSGLTGFSGMLMATRANCRTAAAAHLGLSEGLNVAFRAGAVMGLCVVSLGLGGLSGAYMMFGDIRSLAGFSAGASTIALFARVGGGIYTKAADVGADLVGKVEAGIPEDDPRNPATIADNVGDNVGDVAGMGADLFESYVGSIIATGILGASLPYFYRNQIAMCVFQHLNIDLTCGPAGYPSQLSYANYLCYQDDFFLGYPNLSTWASNTMFIALPFMLALVGLIASVICTFKVFVSKKATSEGATKAEVMHALLMALRWNVLAAGVLIMGGAAGLCWGFFGSSSTFQNGNAGFGSRNLPSYELNPDSATACQPLINEFGQATPIPDVVVVDKYYTPLDTIGFQFPAPNQVPWRLFLTILIGLYLGILIGLITEFYTAGSFPPTKGIAHSGEYGAGAVVIQGLGVGMMSTVLPLSLVFAVIIGAYNLFGAYSIALAAVSMLSTLGVTMATDAYGPVADNAGGIAEMAELPSSVRDKTDALDALGNTTAATGKGFSNGSAVLTAYALLTALVFDSGLAPSPRDLVIINDPNVAHITDYDIVSTIDIYVVASLFLGIMLPHLFGALTMLGVSRAAQAMIVEVRRQFREIPGLREGRSGVRPEHVKCVKISTKAAIIEMVLPGVVAIMSPLIIGFGFGQKALVGLLLGAIGSGYMMGIMMSNAGGAWDNAKKLVESGFFGKNHAKGSEWHKATVAGDTVGDPFKDTSGPAMNILIKLMTVYGLVAINLMQPDIYVEDSRGWIGGLLLALTLIFSALFGWYSYISSEKTREAAKAVGPSIVQAPPKTVSGYYVSAPSVPEEQILFGSQMGDAFQAAGGHRALKRGIIANQTRLPGLGDGAGSLNDAFNPELPVTVSMLTENPIQN
uniref:H(+)-exporting diphosphatase n=1 Tax=Timspurckia oligopyrenoides TaxID=708627 RepID=A0A7S0ZEW4_9RHOD|mmetsp:Transcript_2565/g.4511  ORF Transcript_2565/g.4511 Transcript_2565/m.4511 type:complete len:1220 (+) Transcript_2565:186-3845(+)